MTVDAEEARWYRRGCDQKDYVGRTSRRDCLLENHPVALFIPSVQFVKGMPGMNGPFGSLKSKKKSLGPVSC